MREAMARAEVGDEQEREDPTVLELERRGAELLGHEEAVYLPTATMGNQIALRILGEPGTELLVEERAHIMVSELGGAAFHSGLQTRGLPGSAAACRPGQLRATAGAKAASGRRARRSWRSRTRTTPPAGPSGRSSELRAVVATGRELGLRVHLDGARLVNAAVASGVSGRRRSPGLRHGDALPVERARLSTRRPDRRVARADASSPHGEAPLRRGDASGRHRRGGGALSRSTTTSTRLAEDHARARRLAEGWAAAGLPVDLELVETNFVQVRRRSARAGGAEAIERVRAQGVVLSATGPGILRAVTHLDLTDEDIERALELVPQALGAHVHV